MLSDILRWGGKRPGQPAHSGDSPATRGGDALVPSKALPKFLAAIAHQSETPVLIDLGPVIGANVSFFGEQLGCKLFIEDLFADYDRYAKAGTLDQMAAAMEKRFRHEDSTVDGICAGTSSITCQKRRHRRWPGRSSGCCGRADR